MKRAVIALAAVALLLGGVVSIVPGSAAAGRARSTRRATAARRSTRVRHSPTRSVCVRAIHRIKRHGRVRRVHVRVCVRLTKFIPVAVSRPAVSGRFPSLPAGAGRAPLGDNEPPAPIKRTPFAGYGRGPTLLSLPGLAGASDGATAHAASGGVSITHTFDLAGGPFSVDSSNNIVTASGIRLAELQQSSETSVAYAPGGVVMYTSNGQFGNATGFGTAYSTDGGYVFHRLYATGTGATPSIFPYPTYKTINANGCLVICDQVVTYDKYNDMFVWVIQYPQDNAVTNLPDFVRIAYASPGSLVKHGAAAWSYTDLQSNRINSKVFLDQPRLGVTPGWVYISFNLPKATIVRIAHNAFKDVSFRPHGRPVASKIRAGAVQVVDSSPCPTCSYRIARTTDGRGVSGAWREYFGGIGTTSSSVDLASVADNSNVLVSQNVKTWGMAITNGASLTDWGSIVPDGSDWENRTSHTIANPSVTESHGTVFVAWNEGRTVYNASNQPTDINNNVLPAGSTTYTQPHIGIAGFVDNSSYSITPTSWGNVEIDIPNYTLYYSNELLNPNYALAMPELATAADGEVAMGFYAGGGPSNTSAKGSIYPVHGVGFLWGGHGDPSFVTDVRGNQMTSDLVNVYGDYNTMAPLASNGDCLVSSAVVTQTLTNGNHPVFTLFSHPGRYCPKRTPPRRFPVGATTTHMSLTCPSTASLGSLVSVTGRLTPVASGGQAINVDIAGGPGGGSRTVSTDRTGAFTVTFTPGAGGNYSASAIYTGSLLYKASSGNCHVIVTAPPSSISMNCPATAAPNDGLTLTGQLSPALAGEDITWSAKAPDGTTTNEIDPTDNTATSYFNVTVDQAGTWSFTASWAGNGSYPPAVGTCQIAVQALTTLTLTCPGGFLPPQTPASINGTLTPASNGTPITVSYTPAAGSGGTPGSDGVTTDNTGYYADSYGEDAAGTWTVTATFAGDATRAPAQQSCTFTVLGG